MFATKLAPSACARWQATPAAMSCHTHISCTERCPKHISPTASIAGLKRATVAAALRGSCDGHARRETRLWFAQRVSAGVLALCVIVHLITIIYATRGGLSGIEILSRTRGNGAWLSFYVVFVLAVAVHVPIGLRAITTEWLRWTGASRDGCWLRLLSRLLVMGFGAAWAVFL